MKYTDHTAAAELELYSVNVEAFIKPVIQTLSKKYKAGVFDYEKALIAVERYCLTPAAKQYKLEHGSMTQRWFDMFPKSVRMEAAKEIVDSWLDEFRLGNFWD